MNKLSLVFLLFIMISCTQEQKDNNFSPNSSGNPGEILLVMADKYKDKGEHKVMKELFLSPQIGLPAEEPIFDLLVIPPLAFKNVFKKHRNIITFKIGSKYKTAEIKLKKNVFAHPQNYMEITAPDERSFINLIHEKGGKILAHFHKAELLRLQNTYTKLANKSDMVKLKKKYGVSLTLPNSYKIAAQHDDFVWISNERSNMSQGIFVYFYPYTDTLQLTKKELLNTRDYFLKKYVPGPRDSSYMTTEYRTPLHFKVGDIVNNSYTAEIRGLWRVEGDYMGGPFLNLTTVDENRNRLVTVEGFVYAPKYNKREYLRQVEAILKTLTFVKDTVVVK